MEISDAKRRCKSLEEETEDRISALPQELLHEILFLLPVVDTVRTSLLSKTWLQVWSKNPSIELGHTLFCKTHVPHGDITDYFPTEDETRKFESYVNRTLTRYQQQKIDVQCIFLQVKMINSRFASLVQDWIRIAIHMDTSPTLSISIANFSLTASPTLVPLLLASQRLIELGIKGSDSELPSLLSNVTIISCKFLETLELCNVVLKESEIEYLLSSCPRINNICLKFCIGFKNIRVANLNRLEDFSIEVNKEEEAVIMVEIEAPNLNSFTYIGHHQNRGVVNIKPTQNLQHLRLQKTIITDTEFKNLFSNFPRLESLIIEYPQGLERIDISSPSLKTLKINLGEGQGDQVDGKIDAPCLGSILYCGCFPSITFSKHANPCTTHKLFSIFPPHDFDTSFLFRLRDLALKEKLSAVSVHLRDEASGYIDLEELSSGAAPLEEVEELLVAICSSSMSECRLLMEGLFWMCQPKRFHVSCWEDNNDAEIFLSGILREYRRKHVGCCCIFDDPVKCWRQYFSEVEIESCEKNEDVEVIHSWTFKLRSRNI